ncbi:MAG: glycosyltransferase family 39 protein, partial [Planctomycetes bacterium]|nr:glycosyltransferase family 39 protein [Planctomycetota bacterium]
FERGEYDQAIRQDYHPLSAFSFACANHVQQSVLSAPASPREERQRRERAAYLLSVLAGVVGVWLLIDVSRRLFPNVPAWLVGLLAALTPYLVRTSADIMSDGIFIALFVLAIRQADVALRRRSEHWLGAVVGAGLAGGVTGLAYLTRPEALVLIPAVLVYWAPELRRRPGVTAAQGVFFLLGVAFLAFPYIYALFLESGEWLITRKKSLGSLLGWTACVSIPGGPLRAGVGGAILDARALTRIVDRWFFASPEVLGVAALIGAIAVVRRREWYRGHLLFVTALASLVGVFLLLLHSSQDYGYLTKRHVITLVTLTLPFAARGVTAFSSILASRVPASQRRRVFPFVLAGVLVAIGVKAIAPQRGDQRAQRSAADYILGHGSSEFVLTPREKIAYYCGSERRLWPESAEAIVAEIRSRPEGWIVFYREKWPEISSGLEAAIRVGIVGGTLERDTSFEERDRDPARHLDVYRWRAAPR